MKLSILSGIYADQSANWRSSYPRNLVPVPKAQGISDGYLRPADGIVSLGSAPGVSRGGILWQGLVYRVLGTKLCTVAAGGAVSILGDVGGAGPCRMDYSFDRLGIVSGGNLFFWDGATLAQVTDPDLGTVLDARFIAGYWLVTDGTAAAVTDLTDPTSVNPLRYGSAEADPDPILAVGESRNEAYLFGRHTIQVSQNVGGDNYPFADIPGATVSRGVIGTHAVCEYGGTFAFVGSGRNEAPAVYLMLPGDSAKISTREIDTLLAGYTEAQLAGVVVESRTDKAHEHLLIHLPDQTLVFDAPATKAAQVPVWFTLTSSVVGLGAYRARHAIWAHDRWNVADPTAGAVGYLTDATASQWGAVNGWEFGVAVLYAEGNDALIHEMELVTLAGRVELGADPVVWTSHSFDGLKWSRETAKHCGKRGQTLKRLAWRTQGPVRNLRMQRFRGTSDAFLTMTRLEVQFEPLHTRPGAGRGG